MTDRCVKCGKTFAKTKHLWKHLEKNITCNLEKPKSAARTTVHKYDDFN